LRSLDLKEVSLAELIGCQRIRNRRLRTLHFVAEVVVRTEVVARPDGANWRIGIGNGLFDRNAELLRLALDRASIRHLKRWLDSRKRDVGKLELLPVLYLVALQVVGLGLRCGYGQKDDGHGRRKSDCGDHDMNPLWFDLDT
jgi:hypothetical protein